MFKQFDFLYHKSDDDHLVYLHWVWQHFNLHCIYFQLKQRYHYIGHCFLTWWLGNAFTWILHHMAHLFVNSLIFSFPWISLKLNMHILCDTITNNFDNCYSTSLDVSTSDNNRTFPFLTSLISFWIWAFKFGTVSTLSKMFSINDTWHLNVPIYLNFVDLLSDA